MKGNSTKYYDSNYYKSTKSTKAAAHSCISNLH